MSTTLTIPSSLVLTLLSIVGLFFFIRASVKDRTETQAVRLSLTPPEALTYLVQYFQERRYRIVQQDPQSQTVTLEGFVPPSLFLCLFLTVLAAIGCISLGLVLSITLSLPDNSAYGLVLLSPLAGFFYWRGAGRSEKIVIRPQGIEGDMTIAAVEAHRDELRLLQEALQNTQNS